MQVGACKLQAGGWRLEGKGCKLEAAIRGHYQLVASSANGGFPGRRAGRRSRLSAVGSVQARARAKRKSGPKTGEREAAGECNWNKLAGRAEIDEL